MLEFYRAEVVNSIKTIESIVEEAELTSIEKAELLLAIDYLKRALG